MYELSSIVELNEALAILITVVVLSLVFGSGYILRGDLALYAIITVIAVIGVIPHELAHRWCARKMGSYSRYVLSPIGLVLTLITAIPWIPFKIIMPGFTLVVPSRYEPNYLKRLNGLSGYIGPLTNIVIASVSLATYALLVEVIAGLPWIVSTFLKLNSYINSWIAIFNLLPIPPLDGSKIWSWNPGVWITTFLLGIGLYVVSGYLIGVF